MSRENKRPGQHVDAMNKVDLREELGDRKLVMYRTSMPAKVNYTSLNPNP